MADQKLVVSAFTVKLKWFFDIHDNNLFLFIIAVYPGISINVFLFYSSTQKEDVWILKTKNENTIIVLHIRYHRWKGRSSCCPKSPLSTGWYGTNWSMYFWTLLFLIFDFRLLELIVLVVNISNHCFPFCSIVDTRAMCSGVKQTISIADISKCRKHRSINNTDCYIQRKELGLRCCFVLKVKT